jgi:hypothetical protein
MFSYKTSITMKPVSIFSSEDLKNFNELFEMNASLEIMNNSMKLPKKSIVKQSACETSIVKQSACFASVENTLQKILEKYPENPEYSLKWKWIDISRNPCITPEFVERHPEMPWNWYGLSVNPSITLEFLERHIDKQNTWGYNGLSSNSKITLEFIERYYDKPWDWEELSKNERITPEFIERHINKKWRWYELSKNPSITPDFIERYRDKPWDWVCISRVASEETIEKYPEANWNWFEISKRISLNFVKKHPEMPWEYRALSRNPNITPEFIDSNLNLNIYNNWDWKEIAKNIRVTCDFVKRHKSKWRHWNFSVNPSVTHELIKTFPNEKWVWGKKGFSRNPGITLELINNNREAEWDWKELSRNPGLTLEIIKSFPNEKWDWGYLSSSPIVTQEFIDFYMLNDRFKNRFCRWDFHDRGVSRNPNVTLEFFDRSKKNEHWSYVGLCNNLFEMHPYFKKEERERRIRERVAFLSCQLNLPQDIIKEIANFV